MQTPETTFAPLRAFTVSRKVRGALLAWAILTGTGLQAQQVPTVRPRAGMIITRSLKLRPGTYRLEAPNDSTPVITIRGRGIDVDLTGVMLLGSATDTPPDERRGLAILIDGGEEIRLNGGMIRGYQTGVRAVGTVDLALNGIDLSDNWRPRLFSLIGHESLIDWLSFHHNEQNEWRRFGAAVALEGVHRGHLEGVTVRRGMNGVLLTRSDSIVLIKNDFSFNSGLGIGLYRSTDNVIVRNQVDYNVRGYSRYYRRGQDSANLLMFEQSSRNVVAFNSMTHGGDGLFLWAGQTTMDTGEGGSNDNLFLGNDFSFAPTNAMEATFSRNTFITNLAEGSDHGLWGGYSYDSRVFGNCFGTNRVGIAIEHGQGNVVDRNAFLGDSTAIFLWADSIAPSDWGYPKQRDTRSRDWRITGNVFSRARVGLRIRQTHGVVFDANRYFGIDTLTLFRDNTDVPDSIGTPMERGRGGCGGGMPGFPSDWRTLVRYPTSQAIHRTPLSMAPRDAIVIDEWGPYDWSTPRLWPVDSSRDGPTPLRVLGPSGRWRVAARWGVAALSRVAGASGDTILVTPAPDRDRDWQLILLDSAGRRFAFERWDPIPGWDVRYLNWTDSTGWNGVPFLTRREPRLDKMWYRPPADLPQARWALEATTAVDLPPGAYTLRTISDDAIQVWIDGQLAIDHADLHESLVDHTLITGGRHDLKVRYRQVEGWMELRVEIVRGRVASRGSPGPH